MLRVVTPTRAPARSARSDSRIGIRSISETATGYFGGGTGGSRLRLGNAQLDIGQAASVISWAHRGFPRLGLRPPVDAFRGSNTAGFNDPARARSHSSLPVSRSRLARVGSTITAQVSLDMRIETESKYRPRPDTFTPQWTVVRPAKRSSPQLPSPIATAVAPSVLNGPDARAPTAVATSARAHTNCSKVESARCTSQKSTGKLTKVQVIQTS